MAKGLDKNRCYVVGSSWIRDEWRRGFGNLNGSPDEAGELNDSR